MRQLRSTKQFCSAVDPPSPHPPNRRNHWRKPPDGISTLCTISTIKHSSDDMIWRILNWSVKDYRLNCFVFWSTRKFITNWESNPRLFEKQFYWLINWLLRPGFGHLTIFTEVKCCCVVNCCCWNIVLCAIITYKWAPTIASVFVLQVQSVSKKRPHFYKQS